MLLGVLSLFVFRETFVASSCLIVNARDHLWVSLHQLEVVMCIAKKVYAQEGVPQTFGLRLRTFLRIIHVCVLCVGWDGVECVHTSGVGTVDEPRCFLTPMLLFVGLACLAALPRRTVLQVGTLGTLGALGPAAKTALASSSIPAAIKLTDGTTFPLASFGLQIYDNDMAERLTLAAIDIGYRNFFASVLAQNQIGFARAVKRSGVPREQLFICGSVVSNRAMDEETAYKLTKLGCEENMQAFASGDIKQLDMIMCAPSACFL